MGGGGGRGGEGCSLKSLGLVNSSHSFSVFIENTMRDIFF